MVPSCLLHYFILCSNVCVPHCSKLLFRLLFCLFSLYYFILEDWVETRCNWIRCKLPCLIYHLNHLLKIWKIFVSLLVLQFVWFCSRLLKVARLWVQRETSLKLGKILAVEWLPLTRKRRRRKVFWDFWVMLFINFHNIFSMHHIL